MKKVILKPKESDTVFLEDVEQTKIYAFASGKYIYKAHYVDELYAFIDMNNSRCYANGMYKDLQQLVSRVTEYAVYEFDNQTEFLEWALKISKS